MINLKRGSIFDEKCDLIILCNNYGGVSKTMSDNLMINNLPYYYEDYDSR